MERLRRIFNSTGLWAGLLLAIILLLQLTGGWYAVELSRISREEELTQHLGDLARVAQETLLRPARAMVQLEQDSIVAALAGTGIRLPTPDAELYALGLDRYLTEPLDRLASQARLDRIIVISRSGRVLYDTANPQGLLERYYYWDIDMAEIEQALFGIPRASPAYSTPEMPIKRYYIPVTGAARAVPPLPAGDAGVLAPERPVRAMVCLVAGRSYLAQLDQLTLALTNAGMILMLLIGLIGALIFRLLQRQRLIERQAAEAERLAGLGSLAAGFAHELRNPLGIMRAFTEDLEHTLERDGSGAEAREACRDIVEEVERMDDLVGQFLEFSRGGAPADGAPAAALLLEVCHAVLTMLRPAAEKQRVTLGLEVPAREFEDPDRWQAQIEPGRLRQVLMNLLLNAIQASPLDGSVTLRIEADSRRIELRVHDQGAGIEPQHARRLFEPFFTTRPQGAGLGLAISRRIADAAGGTLDLESTGRGRGTTLRLRLRRLPDADPAARADHHSQGATPHR